MQIITPPFVNLSPPIRNPLFGTAVDGDLVFDGSTAVLGVTPSGSTYQMNRDVMARNVTINNGVTVFMANYAMCVQNTLTNNGTIHNNGPDGPSNGSTTTLIPDGRYLGGQRSNGQSSGLGSTSLPRGYFIAGAGGAASGGAGHVGAGDGGAGATSTGGDSGLPGGTTALHTETVVVSLQDLYNGCFSVGGSASTRVTLRFGGASGGAGGFFSFNPPGSSGAGGGMCWVSASIIAGTGSIRARGGAGSAPAAGGAGGSGGGGGGMVCVVYGTISGTQTIDANGGAGGIVSGHTGGAGGSGSVVKVNLSGDGT